ncbi:hypothetical protein [Methanohalophilus sp.]
MENIVILFTRKYYTGENMDGIDQAKVYFVCNTCSFVFQADPNFMPIKCPQCGSEDTVRT